MLQDFLVAGILAVFVEGLVEYFVPKKEEGALPREWIKYVSAGLGIMVSVAYEVDILSSLEVISIYPFVGSIITGIIIGRGSNYLNDFWKRVKGGFGSQE